MHQSRGGHLVITLNTGTNQQQPDRGRTRRIHLVSVPDQVLITPRHETPVHINSITIKKVGSQPQGRGVSVNTIMFSVVQSQALTAINHVCSTVLYHVAWWSERGNRAQHKVCPCCCEKQITVTSSGGAGANHFSKSLRYQGNVVEAGEVTV